MVFVFGINRDELCNSLNSVYGEIDASIYLRRFFDMEFTLPEVDSERFCRSLMDRFHFEEFFRTLSTNASTRLHNNDYNGLSQCFPVLCGGLGLSLRDIDYCARLISLTCRNLEERYHIYPRLLSLLIPLKLEESNSVSQTYPWRMSCKRRDEPSLRSNLWPNRRRSTGRDVGCYRSRSLLHGRSARGTVIGGLRRRLWAN